MSSSKSDINEYLQLSVDEMKELEDDLLELIVDYLRKKTLFNEDEYGHLSCEMVGNPIECASKMKTYDKKEKYIFIMNGIYVAFDNQHLSKFLYMAYRKEQENL